MYWTNVRAEKILRIRARAISCCAFVFQFDYDITNPTKCVLVVAARHYYHQHHHHLHYFQTVSINAYYSFTVLSILTLPYPVPLHKFVLLCKRARRMRHRSPFIPLTSPSWRFYQSNPRSRRGCQIDRTAIPNTRAPRTRGCVCVYIYMTLLPSLIHCFELLGSRICLGCRKRLLINYRFSAENKRNRDNTYSVV